jgi:cell wall-associated NlpC family hydrolase
MRRTTSVTSTVLISLGLLAGAGAIAPSAAQAADTSTSTRTTSQQDKIRKAERMRSEVVRTALNQVGDAYGYAGAGPNVFDCSGLTQYAWKSVGVNLTHYSRAQYDQTKRISLKEARPGDLAFYFNNGARHVSLYIGNGKVVHASTYGVGVVKGVVKGTTWTNKHFTGMGRVKLPR